MQQNYRNNISPFADRLHGKVIPGQQVGAATDHAIRAAPEWLAEAVVLLNALAGVVPAGGGLGQGLDEEVEVHRRGWASRRPSAPANARGCRTSPASHA